MSWRVALPIGVDLARQSVVRGHDHIVLIMRLAALHVSAVVAQTPAMVLDNQVVGDLVLQRCLPSEDLVGCRPAVSDR
jgi:hypothetical protein